MGAEELKAQLLEAIETIKALQQENEKMRRALKSVQAYVPDHYAQLGLIIEDAIKSGSK